MYATLRTLPQIPHSSFNDESDLNQERNSLQERHCFLDILILSCAFYLVPTIDLFATTLIYRNQN